MGGGDNEGYIAGEGEEEMSKLSRGNLRGAKLSPVQVIEIRNKYDGGRSQRQLCLEYNVSVGTIGRIVRGESWKRYGGPGDHEGADRPSLDMQMEEEGLERAAEEYAPGRDSLEIQASLARLAGLLGTKAGTSGTEGSPPAAQDGAVPGLDSIHTEQEEREDG